jgi:hypothetical protein
MLTNEKDGDGLGVFVDGSEQTLRFSHGGRNAGFDSFMIAYANVGQGAVIMMNANDTGTSRAIINAVAKQYGWSNGIPLVPPKWQLNDVLRVIMEKHPIAVRGAALAFSGATVVTVFAGRKIFQKYVLRPKRS